MASQSPCAPLPLNWRATTININCGAHFCAVFGLRGVPSACDRKSIDVIRLEFMFIYIYYVCEWYRSQRLQNSVGVYIHWMKLLMARVFWHCAKKNMKKTYLFALATRFKFKQNTITIYKYRYKGNICNDICPCSYNLFKLERLAPIYIYIYATWIGALVCPKNQVLNINGYTIKPPSPPHVVGGRSAAVDIQIIRTRLPWRAPLWSKSIKWPSIRRLCSLRTWLHSQIYSVLCMRIYVCLSCALN